jgi:hypothetical protein
MRCIGVVALGALLCLSAPAKAEIVVNISKSQQRLAVVVDGTELYRWPVSTGRRGYATPSGTFHPMRLERHWYSRQYEMTPMPWAMFFFRGYAVHGTMEAYNLGHAASHGCVRLRPDNASTLFSLVHKRRLGATKIVVMNGPLPALPGAVPMADASHDTSHDTSHDASHPQARDVPDEHFAKALPGDVEPVEVKVLPPRHAALRGDDVEISLAAHVRTQQVAPYQIASRGGEAEVMRGRQAWLRGLAHKYGYSSW